MRRQSIVLICLNLLSMHALAGIDLFSNSSVALESPSLFYAKNPININSNQLLVPKHRGGFLLGVDFNYLTPNDNQLNYAIIDPFLIAGNAGLPIAPSTLSRIKSIEPHDNFGYSGEIGYTFPQTGTDLLFHYQNFTDHTSSSGQAPGGGAIWNSLSIFSLGIVSEQAASRSSFDFEQADLTLGNGIVVGCNFVVHPYWGAAYMKLSKNMHTTYFNTRQPADPTLIGDDTVDSNSYFRGVGPRIGLDTEYLFKPNFGLVTHATTSLYLGIVNSEMSEHATGTLAEFVTGTRIQQPNVNRAVPALEGKLGLAYRFVPLNIQVEAGYQASHYFNAINSYRIGESAVVSNYLKHVHDFNLYGPYLNVSLYDFPHRCELPCEPFHVGSIRAPGGFEFAIGFLRLMPNLDQLDYGILDPDPVLFDGDIIAFPSERAKILVHEPRMDWGWQADFGYHFPCTAFDIRANYQTFLGRHSERVSGGDGFIFNSLSLVADSFAAPRVSEEVVSKHRLDYDKLDLDVGQVMGSSPNWQFRLFGGLRYTNIENKFETFYQDMSDTFLRSGFDGDGYILQDNKMEGVGPRLGAKLSFQFTDFFSLIAEGGSAILVADKHSSYRDTEPANPTTLFPLTIYEQRESSEDEIVPNLDAKIGLNFHTCYHTHVIGVELGYLVNHYFNAATRYKPIMTQTMGIKQVSDIDLHGYYVNVVVGGTPPNCRPVVQPYGNSEFVGGFELGVEVLFLQVTSPHLVYAVVDPNPVLTPAPVEFLEELPGPNSEVKKIEPHNDGGYRVHLGYAFPCSTFDIAVNYFDYSTDKTSTTGAPQDGGLWMLTLPAEGAFSLPALAQTARAEFKFDLRNTDLEFAKNIKIDHLNLRFLTGASYLHVDESHNIVYSGVTSITDVEPLTLTGGESIVSEDYEYKGLGPRFGIDSLLELGGGLGFVGHAASNFYVGVLDSEHTEQNTVPFPLTGTAYSTQLRDKKRNRLVSELELKAGVNYVMPFFNSFLMLEAGYECDHYFNLLNNFRFTSPLSRGYLKQESDLSLTGPYVKVQFTF